MKKVIHTPKKQKSLCPEPFDQERNNSYKFKGGNMKKSKSVRGRSGKLSGGAGRKALMLGGLGAGLLALSVASAVQAKDWGEYQSGERRSGYTYMTNASRAIQNDEFENPGMLWVEQGEAIWSKKDGKAGKACKSCHKDAAKSMKGVSITFPKYSKKAKKLKSLPQQVNLCRTQRMKAKAWKWESGSMLSMLTYLRHQSFGMKIKVNIKGKAAPFFAKGKAFFYQRRGELDMACKHCHEDNAGNMIRANTLSQGQINGFPVYRLKWQKVGTIHRRFKGCNKQVRAKPYKSGSDEYNNLELFVKWRGRGLVVETPAVRN